MNFKLFAQQVKNNFDAMTDQYTLHGAGLAISAGILQYILLGRKS